MAQELERLGRDPAAESERLGALVKAVSHDLKAPVRGIRACATWLEKELDVALTDNARENLEFLRSRVDHLGAVLEGMQAYVDLVGVSAPIEEVDTRSLIEGVVRKLAVTPPAKIALSGSFGPISCCRRQLEEVFRQLLKNALRFSARPDVRIDISAHPEGDVHRFSVQDNGPGMTDEVRQRAFEVFFKGSRTNEEGLGIGLSVCRAIVERNGGTIAVPSLEGEGSTVSFSFPRRLRDGRG